MSRRIFLSFTLVFAGLCRVDAQTIFSCNEAAVSPVIKGEGITERVGDIAFNCAGGMPGANISGNFSIFLTVNITNRVESGHVTGVIFTVDNGSGPQPISVPGFLASASNLVYNGVAFTLSPTGTATLRIANIRAAANQLNLSPNISIRAFVAFNSNLAAVNSSQFDIGTPLQGLFSGYSTSLICTSHGSQLPANTQSFKSFISSNAAFASTRLTEGFADAFVQRSAPESLNADTGTRFLITYSGFPPGAQLFVPDAIAGSDAIIPTSGGDLGEPASGGRYAPTTTGSLLLARVHNTDANGAGGSLAFVPGSPGSGVVNFDSMNQVVLDNGSGMLVYEVVDANPSAQESAQFPTYLGLAPFSGDPVITTEVVSFAPVSVITQATTHDPIPRFQALPPPADCHIIGDCGAFYYPKLFVNTTPLSFTATSGGGFQVGYFQVNNRGGGHLVWAVTISYTNGNGWLKLTPADGIDNSTVRVDADPGSLTAGMYEAVLTVDAGPQAGSMIVPVTFVVNAQPPPPPAPTVTSVVNAATFATGPAVAGSISTVTGQQLGGKNVVVGFDGTPGQVLFDSTKQINVVVPSSLGNKTSAQLVVIVDGSDSVPQTVPLAPFNPGIFSNGILNRDGTVNGSSHPAPPMSVLQIFATGLSGNGEITATLNGNAIATEYGGPAPGLPGVQQVNVQLPAGLPGSTAQVAVCGTVKGSQSTCSPAVQVMLAP